MDTGVALKRSAQKYVPKNKRRHRRDNTPTLTTQERVSAAVWRMCTRKTGRWFKQEIARAFAKSMGGGMHVYHCPHCKLYHVGH
jgi:hypothetical protein